MDMTVAERQTGQQDGNAYNLFKLTWPIFLELFLFMLIGITDTFMLSGVSDAAVSAVGAANQFIFIAILILEVAGHGASIVVAQYIGSKKMVDAARVGAVAVTLNLLIGIAISVSFVLFGNALLERINLQGQILQMAQSYMIIVGEACLFRRLSIHWQVSFVRIALQKRACISRSASMCCTSSGTTC